MERLIFAVALLAAVTLSVTQMPPALASAALASATPYALNRVTGDVATFTPTPSEPTATPTAALAGGPQELPKPTPWPVVARLFLPLIEGE